jgi:hypothetical protein
MVGDEGLADDNSADAEISAYPEEEKTTKTQRAQRNLKNLCVFVVSLYRLMPSLRIFD